MRRKLSALIAAAFMVVSMPVFADVTIDSLSTSTADSSITVSGTTTEDSENVIITVFPSDADVSTEEGFFSNIAYQNPIKSKDGKYSLTFRMLGADIFTLVATCDDGKDSKEFAYGDKESVIAKIEEVNAADAADVADLLQANQAVLGLLVDGVSEEPNWSELGAKVAANRPYGTTDLNATILDLQRQLILQYVTDEVITDIFVYEDILNIFDLKNNSVYFTEDGSCLFSDANKATTNDLIVGLSFDSYSDFCDVMVEKMILAFIESPNGASNAQLVMIAYEDLIGIDTEGVKLPVYTQIANKAYASLAKLKEKFVELTAPEDKDEGGSTNNDRGNSGGGGGGTINVPGTTIVAPAPVGEEMFHDIANYGWAKESIEGLALQGIVSGKATGYFYPADSVTRSEFVKMMVLALDIQGKSADMNFADVSQNAWDYPYIRIAYSTGIINGLGDGRFGGNELISRQDMAVIIHRAMEYCGKALPDRSDAAFADDAAIADYAVESAYILRAAGIMNGDDLNNLNPVSSATRAEAAKVIYALVK